MNDIYIQYMYSYPHKTAYRPLAGVNLKDYGERLRGKGHGLYVHIPFCETKCGYCNLFSVTGQRREAVDGYLLGVERQLLQYGEILKAVGGIFRSHHRRGNSSFIRRKTVGAGVFHDMGSCGF